MYAMCPFDYRNTLCDSEMGCGWEWDAGALRAFVLFRTVFPIFCLQAGKVYSIYFVPVLL